MLRVRCAANRQGPRADGYYTASRMNPRSSAARLPPTGLTGLDPTWSTLITAADADGVDRTWHVLDTGGQDTRGTVLCVHGNPNWSYMWRGLARRLSDYRVIAVDALNMGYSERTGEQRRLADHIADLESVTNALRLDGPVITVAHDWGGPISMGWAERHIEQLAGVVLMNTGVARPAAAKVPPLITVARATLGVTCETTPAFLHGALRMARPQLSPDVYRGYAAPYGSPAQRTGIRDFVEDIPVDDSHQTFETLASVASGLSELHDVPALLLWGAKDIIFSDLFLHDLMERLPHAAVHRYPDAGHQIIEDTSAVDVIDRWISQRDAADDHLRTPQTSASTRPMWSGIESRRGDESDAVVEMDANNASAPARSISFDELGARIDALARGLRAAGIAPGDRLASLVPPGIDLTVLVYACLRAGVVLVAPDAALGLGGVRQALRSSRPDHLVGDWRGLLLAKAMRLPATGFSVNPMAAPLAAMAGVSASLDELCAAGQDLPMAAVPPSESDAVIVFTSGSTGPSKGVVYTHGQLESQRDAIRSAFAVQPDDKVVVAFAPFAVLAPALGIASIVPTMDVTAPAELRAQAVADAATAIDASIVFASPSVLAKIAATSRNLTETGRRSFEAIRLIATAGAPVSPQLLARVQPVFENAEITTPYGMTEVMPVTVVSPKNIGETEIERTTEAGVCVGTPLPGAEVAIRALDAPSGAFPSAVSHGVLGEVWVRAAHASNTYDRLWAQQQHAFVVDDAGQRWHRTGDVGHIDTRGHLWIEGRVEHLIHGPTGITAPVQTELQAESITGVEQAAAVGIGPVGTQQVAVVVAGQGLDSAVVANASLAAAIRAAVTVDVAAVLVAPAIPVDRRHNSKIDRARVQRWAAAHLSGKTRQRL